ncbi:MAG: hypothetical protein VKK59_02300, partial [Vampirovibrionales bacterium]|nr:hypothetical protein [Vampirovibrionales bacterium]
MAETVNSIFTGTNAHQSQQVRLNLKKVTIFNTFNNANAAAAGYSSSKEALTTAVTFLATV